MIYLIYPLDPTTSFLDKILEKFSPSIKEGNICVIKCDASKVCYKTAKEQIQTIPENSKVIFMGHGTSEILYGGASEYYQKESLISLKEMQIFKNKTLILMSCYSGKLLESSRKCRDFADSIGFGLLPSCLSETEGKANLEKLNLNDSDIKDYQGCLVDIFIQLTALLLNTTNTTEQIVDKLKLLINTKINTNILELNNTKLANLLYYSHADIHQY